jgi:hypothetical protein
MTTDSDIVRELLRRAILTLAALPDPDLRFRLGPRCAWPPIVQAVHDAYAAAPPTVRIFQPTAADISRWDTVFDWLRWYAREHDPQNVRLFKARIFGKSIMELQQLCMTERGQPAKSRTTIYAKLDHVVNTIAIKFKEEILLYRIDGLNELNDFDRSRWHLGECVESDLNDLPTSPKACISAISEPLSPKDEARAHKLLTKRMQRTRLAAMQRKHTKPAPQTLRAAVRC